MIHLRKGVGRLLVLLLVVVLAPERHPRRTESRTQLHRLFQVPLPFRLVRLRDAANVLLERIHANLSPRCDKRLLGPVKRGIELPRKPPRQCAEDSHHVAHLPAHAHRRQHAQVRHIYQRRFGHNAGSIRGVAAHYNRIRVQRLRQLQRARPRGMKPLRQSQMVQRIHAVGAAGGLESRRSEAHAQDLRRRLAHPLQAWLPGAIVKGQHKQHASAAGRPRAAFACRGVRLLLRPGCRRQNTQNRQHSARRQPLNSPPSHSSFWNHNRSIIGSGALIGAACPCVRFRLAARICAVIIAACRRSLHHPVSSLCGA